MSDPTEKCQRCGAMRSQHHATYGFCPSLAELLGKARCEQRDAERQRDALIVALEEIANAPIYLSMPAGEFITLLQKKASEALFRLK